MNDVDDLRLINRELRTQRFGRGLNLGQHRSVFTILERAVNQLGNFDRLFDAKAT